MKALGSDTILSSQRAKALAHNMLHFVLNLECMKMRTGDRSWFVLLGLIPFWLEAGNWSHYRGSDHNGISNEPIRTDWDSNPPVSLWKTSLEPALSSFTVGDGLVYTQIRRSDGFKNFEWCVALEADSGDEVWATRLGVADYPNGGVGADDGPRSTPVVDGDRVYVISTYLGISCLQADTGQEIWSRDLVAELGSGLVPWQNAASPVIVGELVLLNGNAGSQKLMGLNKLNGATAWRAHDDTLTQATPVATSIDEVAQVIFFTRSGLVAVEPESGDSLWRYAFPFSVSTAASPVVWGDLIYCSAAYGKGAGVVRVEKQGGDWSSEEVWRTPFRNMNHWATPVVHEGFLYGIYGQTRTSLKCLDMRSGEERWSVGGVGRGGVVSVSDHLLVLTESGELVLVEPDPDAYTESARIQAVDGKCWNVPAISEGRIYVRSTTQAACYEVASALAPPPMRLPELTLRFEKLESGLYLVVGSDDGSPLSERQSTAIEVVGSDEIEVVSSQWEPHAGSFVVENGELRLEISDVARKTLRFYQVREKP